jgi:hypothetical protein
MNMDVTQSIISDLWPLYVSGDASADTRSLVEAFLAADPAFASMLRETSSAHLGIAGGPALPPDHELRTLSKIKRRLWGYAWLLQLAILFSCFAFGRIVSDTSWDVSPRNFIIMASIAGVFWIAFFVTLIRNRARILLVTPGRRRHG